MDSAKTVLIVDDEPMVRRLLSSTLKRAGYRVEQASDGEQAWGLLQTWQPDVLITDIDMPRMTGEQLCKLVEQAQPDRVYPIFVTTSKTALEHRGWSRQMEHVWFIEKPVSMRKLLDQLRDALETTRADWAAEG